MTLEDLIYKRLIEAEEITRELATFGDLPAIFYQKAPDDQEQGWTDQRQYPRLDFVVDMQANPERQTSGLVSLNIWSHEAGTEPEAIEPLVLQELKDLFMQPTEGPPYCLRWARSDSFELRQTVIKETQVIGITVLFDVLAFPSQETSDPDPIMAMNRFIRELVPEGKVIGADKLPAYFRAERARPAFYFRLANIGLDRETNTVAWMTGTIRGHIFAPEAEERIQWLKAMIDQLAIQGEVTMPDNSPMFIRNIKGNSAADYLGTGQLELAVNFGILRRPIYAHTMKGTQIDTTNQNTGKDY